MDIAHNDSMVPALSASQAIIDVSPVMSLGDVGRMFAEFETFVRDQMKPDQDYGLIPGSKKPNLWKPGAEKLAFWHGLGIDNEHVAGEVSPAYVSHTYNCRLVSLRSGQLKATCEGSANSAEPRFAKTAEKQNIKDMRALDNDIRKRAIKRAMVGAVLLATAGSGYFDSASGEHDEEDGNGSSDAEPQTKLCTIHGVKMRRYERDGQTWYSHKTDDGKWCSGPKDEKASKPTQTGAPQPKGFDVNTIPTAKGDMLNWIEQGRAAKGMSRQDIDGMAKQPPFLHGAISQCTDDELSAICEILQHKWLNPAPEAANA